jgi:hypothetical protein
MMLTSDSFWRKLDQSQRFMLFVHSGAGSHCLHGKVARRFSPVAFEHPEGVEHASLRGAVSMFFLGDELRHYDYLVRCVRDPLRAIYSFAMFLHTNTKTPWHSALAISACSMVAFDTSTSLLTANVIRVEDVRGEEDVDLNARVSPKPTWKEMQAEIPWVVPAVKDMFVRYRYSAEEYN